MLRCDGYVMFHGMVRTAMGDLVGTWLYRPDNDYWYLRADDGGFASSWAPDDLDDFRDDEPNDDKWEVGRHGIQRH